MTFQVSSRGLRPQQAPTLNPSGDTREGRGLLEGAPKGSNQLPPNYFAFLLLEVARFAGAAFAGNALTRVLFVVAMFLILLRLN
jgi:hypothetical protein